MAPAREVKRKKPFRSFHWVLRKKGADENPKSLGLMSCRAQMFVISRLYFRAFLEVQSPHLTLNISLLLISVWKMGGILQSSLKPAVCSRCWGSINFVSSWHCYGWWDYKLLVPMLNPTAAFLVAVVLRLLFPAVKPKGGSINSSGNRNIGIYGNIEISKRPKILINWVDKCLPYELFK